MPSFSFASSSGSASNLPASSSSTSASGSVDTLGSASSASSQSHSLTVGNNVRIENRERHLHHFEQSVLSIEQVEEFNDFFNRGVFDIAEPLFQS